MCDSVNHSRFPKEDHLPNWERRDNKVTKGDRAKWTTETHAYPIYHEKGRKRLRYVFLTPLSSRLLFCMIFSKMCSNNFEKCALWRRNIQL